VESARFVNEVATANHFIRSHAYSPWNKKNIYKAIAIETSP
jgi:hypothetical protein